MKKMMVLIFTLSLFDLMGQVDVVGRVMDEENNPIPYATIAFQSTSLSDRLVGAFTNAEGDFMIKLPADQYEITIQMVGYENLILNRSISEALDLGTLIMGERVDELQEVVVRAERSYIEHDLGKKTLHVGSDLANAGSTAVDALESLPSVTTTLNGGINVRGSENVIIYVNGRETKRDPKSLQFISADALQKIELITNPSAKYDAEGVAGIINLVYAKTRTTKLELFGSLSTPFRGSLGVNTSVSSEKFTLYVNANERRSLFENSDNQIRVTPEDSLSRFDNLTFSKGNGLTREVNAGFSFEPDTSFTLGLEVNYLRWDDRADQSQNGIFEYENGNSESIGLLNDWREIEDEVSLTFSSEKRFGDQSLKFQLTAGGEDEINQTTFNKENVAISNTPIQQSIRSSDETEDQRYYQAKLDYSIPLLSDLTVEAGAVMDVFDINVDQALEFFESPDISNRFLIEMDKYGTYLLIENKRRRFEYAVGLRYERFQSKSLQKSTDSTFSQHFNNLFPSVQWKYPIGKQSLGFSFTRRINRPSFWEVSPFLSYTDPLNIETGNPFLKPEFGYLYELTWSGNWKNIDYDVTGFRRTTENVIQRITMPLDQDRLLITFDNLGVRHDDGLEWNASFDFSDLLTIEANGSFYRTFFEGENEEVFFNRKWNWQTRLKQRLRFDKGWTIDLTQYYRAPRYGAQSVSLSQYYLNASVQKSFMEKRGNITLSLRDVFNSRIFGSEVVGEDFGLVNEFKFQTQVLTLSMRYKLIN